MLKTHQFQMDFGPKDLRFHIEMVVFECCFEGLNYDAFQFCGEVYSWWKIAKAWWLPELPRPASLRVLSYKMIKKKYDKGDFHNF